MSLAHRLGFKSVRHMRAALTGPELIEWLAFFQIEAEDNEKRHLQRLAQQAALADLNHMSKR